MNRTPTRDADRTITLLENLGYGVLLQPRGTTWEATVVKNGKTETARDQIDNHALAKAACSLGIMVK